MRLLIASALTLAVFAGIGGASACDWAVREAMLPMTKSTPPVVASVAPISRIPQRMIPPEMLV